MSYRLFFGMVFSAVVAMPAVAATPDQPLKLDQDQLPVHEPWLVNGGEFKIRFNEEMLAAYGIRALGAEPTPKQGPVDEEFARFALIPAEGLQFNAPEGGFDRFTGGALGLAGGFALSLPGGERLGYKQGLLRYNAATPTRLELVSDDGRAWFYVNHLMYKMVDDYSGFFVRSADLRVSAALAKRLAAPDLADQYIGEIKLRADVVARPSGFVAPEAKAVLACPDFHGTPFGTDGIYEADVLMESYSMSTSRCRLGNGTGTCDGSGPDDGDVVFTPSSTLRNSNKSNTADVPWYEKFTTSPFNFPYTGNDQHPYLIWNMYRIVDDQLEQIGASGVKHAFLTTNGGCAAGACTGGGHILGKNCGDTYGTGNNDGSSSLGPRSELIPARGQWARCGSIFDPDCNGVQNSSGNTSYSQRMIVKESKMTPVPGAVSTQYFSESWYIVQDDINIYNTMAHRTMAPSSSGSTWSPGSQGSFVLGPVVNTWVDPLLNPTRNIELASTEGHSRVAVKASLLASCPIASGLVGTCYRYDYVVNNLDFARVEYMPAPNNVGPNLGITSSRGFSTFRLDLGSAVPVWIDPVAHFADIDSNATNDWSVLPTAESIVWTAPVSGNELNWGKLFRFSFVSTAVPNPAFTRQVYLDVNATDEAVDFVGRLMVPNVGTLFMSDFE